MLGIELLNSLRMYRGMYPWDHTNRYYKNKEYYRTLQIQFSEAEIIAANDLLHDEFHRAEKSLRRIVLNTNKALNQDGKIYKKKGEQA